MFRTLIAVIVLSGFSWSVYAEGSDSSSDQSRTIQVAGNGAISGVPDKLQFTVYLEEKGKLATKLNEVINSRSTQIIKFLLNSGIEEKDLQSMQVNLRPDFRRTQEGQVQDGYVLSRAIKISLRNLQAYPQILDGILKYGANRIDGFTYQMDNQQAHYLSALELAVSNAQQRADKLASSLGVKVGKVVSVQETSSHSPRPMFEARMAMADAGPSYTPGTMDVSAGVLVEFVIVD